MNGTSYLQAIEVDCRLGDRPVLHGLSLSVQAGEVLAVVGPNGAGKTTLLRALARLLRPVRGQVLLDGGDLWQRSASAAARRIAFMPQQQHNDWPLSVHELIALGRAPHRGWWRPLRAGDRKVIDNVLERLHLTEFRERRIGQLSGGEWQRTRLALALSQEPRFLLLDEPTAHLDLRFQVALLELAEELAHRDGLGVVISLHDLNQAAQWADRIVLLGNGRMAACGAAGEVLTPAHLQDVYHLPVSVQPHPVYGTPFVAPLKDGP